MSIRTLAAKEFLATIEALLAHIGADNPVRVIAAKMALEPVIIRIFTRGDTAGPAYILEQLEAHVDETRPGAIDARHRSVQTRDFLGDLEALEGAA